MLKDPWTAWEQGSFPYDAFEEAGLTPEASMKQVQDAYFTLTEKGLWNDDRRAAWNQLRKLEGRLWVDFLQYDLSVEEIAQNLERLAGAEPGEAVLTEFERMQQDFRPLDLQEVLVEPIPDFEPPAEAAGAPERDD